MAVKEIVKLVFSEKDLAELISEKYDLNPSTVTINIVKYNGDAREPSYTSITVEGTKKGKGDTNPFGRFVD